MVISCSGHLISIFPEQRFHRTRIFINGRTLLIVAIDDFDKHHNSLQLSIDHFSEKHNNKLLVFHDGTLTAGKNGRVKRSVVVDYVKKNSNLKIEGDRIHLGEIDVSHLLYVDSQCMKEFVSNLITYALLRDQIRKLSR